MLLVCFTLCLSLSLSLSQSQSQCLLVTVSVSLYVSMLPRTAFWPLWFSAPSSASRMFMLPKSAAPTPKKERQIRSSMSFSILFVYLIPTMTMERGKLLDSMMARFVSGMSEISPSVMISRTPYLVPGGAYEEKEKRQ